MFRLTWFIRTNIHYVYGLDDVETSFIFSNLYTIISFKCLEVFLRNFVFFRILFIFKIHFYDFLYFFDII